MDHATFYGPDSIKRHMARYQWAITKLMPTDNVLDAGCGSGYGTLMLANACSRAVGVDVSSEAIEYAKWKSNHIHGLNIEYLRDDLSDMTIFELFDAVICIEVIEHMEQELQARFMRILPKMLAYGGRFIVTTPAKGETPMTNFHRHEFGRHEFHQFLERHFWGVHFDDPLKHGLPPEFMLAVCVGVKK